MNFNAISHAELSGLILESDLQDVLFANGLCSSMMECLIALSMPFLENAVFAAGLNCSNLSAEPIDLDYLNCFVIIVNSPVSNDV